MRFVSLFVFFSTSLLLQSQDIVVERRDQDEIQLENWEYPDDRDSSWTPVDLLILDWQLVTIDSTIYEDMGELEGMLIETSKGYPLWTFLASGTGRGNFLSSVSWFHPAVPFEITAGMDIKNLELNPTLELSYLLNDFYVERQFREEHSVFLAGELDWQFGEVRLNLNDQWSYNDEWNSYLSTSLGYSINEKMSLSLTAVLKKGYPILIGPTICWEMERLKFMGNLSVQNSAQQIQFYPVIELTYFTESFHLLVSLMKHSQNTPLFIAESPFGPWGNEYHALVEQWQSKVEYAFGIGSFDLQNYYIFHIRDFSIIEDWGTEISLQYPNTHNPLYGQLSYVYGMFFSESSWFEQDNGWGWLNLGVGFRPSTVFEFLGEAGYSIDTGATMSFTLTYKG